MRLRRTLVHIGLIQCLLYMRLHDNCQLHTENWYYMKCSRHFSAIKY